MVSHQWPQLAFELLSPSYSSPPLGGEARRGGNDVRLPLSLPLPLAGERSLKKSLKERLKLCARAGSNA